MAFTTLVVLLLSTPAAHAASDCTLADAKRATVASVKDGDTLALTDGTTVRLIGAKAPRAPLGWRGDDPWPMVKEEEDALSRLAVGQEVELQYGGTRTDRHGNALAQVFVIKGGQRVWLQESLVAHGLARVYSFPDNRACVSELLAREAAARDKKLGIWGVSAYRIQHADDIEHLGRLVDSYQLVEGKVAAVGGSGGRVYLNFGKDWHTDFTVTIDGRDKRAFADAGMDPKDLAGKTVRVRGWIEWRNGPMIEGTHPEQIEILPDTEIAAPETKPAPPVKEAPASSVSL